MTPENGPFEIIRKAASLRAPTLSTELPKFMVFAWFCQSKTPGLDPTVGIGRRHVDLFRRHNQQELFLDIRQRVNLVALANPQRPATEKKKRHIRAQ